MKALSTTQRGPAAAGATGNIEQGESGSEGRAGSGPPSARAYRPDRASHADGAAVSSGQPRETRHSERAPVAVRAGDVAESSLEKKGQASAVDGLPLEPARDTARGLAPPSRPPNAPIDEDAWFDQAPAAEESAPRAAGLERANSPIQDTPPVSEAWDGREPSSHAAAQLQWLRIPAALRDAARAAIRCPPTRQKTVQGLGPGNSSSDHFATPPGISEFDGGVNDRRGLSGDDARRANAESVDRGIFDYDSTGYAPSVAQDHSESGLAPGWETGENEARPEKWRLALVIVACVVALSVIGVAWFLRSQQSEARGGLPSNPRGSTSSAPSASAVQGVPARGRVPAVAPSPAELDADGEAEADREEPGESEGSTAADNAAESAGPTSPRVARPTRKPTTGNAGAPRRPPKAPKRRAAPKAASDDGQVPDELLF